MSVNGQVPAQGESHFNVLAKQAHADSEKWFGDIPASQTLAHHLLGLGGEVGELMNVYKKIERGSLDPKNPAVIHQLRMETMDVQVYILNIIALLQFDMDALLQHGRALNEKRFMEQRAEREAARAK